MLHAGTHGVSPARRKAPRCWNAEGFIPLQLEALTPVFVGSGEELSPLDYVIRKENGACFLHLVDSSAWLLAQGEDSTASKALNNGDMLRLRRHMADHLDAAAYSLASMPIQSEVVASELLARIKNPDSKSKAEVLPFARNPLTCAPVLPGSSIKGAISTAIIDRLDKRLAKNQNLKAAARSSKSGYQDTLKKLFGSIGEHAMQALKVADIAVPPGGTAIYAAQEKHLHPDKPGTPKAPCEALLPSGPGGPLLYGSLHLDCGSGSPAIVLPGGAVFDWEKISALCKEFYIERFNEEWNKFYTLPHFRQTRDALGLARERIEKLNPETDLLLRVGRYSHIECVTVSDNAPQCKKGYGHTRTLADGLLPFGWIILHRCRQEEYANGVEETDRAIALARHKRECSHAEREARMARAVEQKRQMEAKAALARELAEAEKKKRELEAAELEAKLAGLSPEERAIAALGMPGATEKDSMELFSQLDKLDAGLRHRAALALKDFWSGIGKWAGKQSRKQAGKIERVKEILAE